MARPFRRYQQEMYENLGFFATWLPGDLLELGDIGVLKNGQFRKENSLKDLQIKYEVTAPGASQNLQYTSKSGTGFALDLSATIPQPFAASAAVKVEFSDEGAFLFHASNVRNRRLEGGAQLAETILAAHKAGKWKPDWYLVESVHVADCATIIVSEDQSSAVSFQANAKGALGPVPLADPQVNLSVSSSRGRMMQVVAGRSLRPLYSCVRVKPSWFSNPSLEPVRGEGGGASPFIRSDITELLNS